MNGGGWVHEWNLDADPTAPASVTNPITYAPQGLPMTIRAYLGTTFADPTKLVGTKSVANVCAGVNLAVTVPTSNPITYANVNVTAQELCIQNQSVGRFVPSDGVYATAQGLPFVTGTTGSNGTVTLSSLIVGKTYNISVVNRDGNSQSRPYTVLSANNTAQVFSFPITCTPATGTTGGTSQGAFKR